MPDTIVAHQHYQLDFHDTALRSEFATWQERANAYNRLQKHNSQIIRITHQLTGALDKITAQNEADGDDIAASLARQTRILGIYRLWSYFREKFALRESELFFNLLEIADELAWACYKPARKAALDAGTIAKTERREPPLIFFSGNTSPFVLERGRSFLPEGIETAADVRHFDKILFRLPVPLVAIPWFQLNHLPACVVIAHEVGHAVEIDFGLTEPLQTLFEGLDLPEDHKPLWMRWREELFADVWGLLCCGPGYLIALSDYLVNERAVVQSEERTLDDRSRYPTSTLRLRFNEALLKRYHLLTVPDTVTDEPEVLQTLLNQSMKTWQETYEFHEMEAFETDIEVVLDALLAQRFSAFGDERLDEVISFDPADLKASWLAARRLLGQIELKESRFRRLFTAIALAWLWQPDQYLENSLHTWLVDSQLLAQIPEGKRGASGIDVSSEQQKSADLKAGAELFDLL